MIEKSNLRIGKIVLNRVDHHVLIEIAVRQITVRIVPRSTDLADRRDRLGKETLVIQSAAHLTITEVRADRSVDLAVAIWTDHAHRIPITALPVAIRNVGHSLNDADRADRRDDQVVPVLNDLAQGMTIAALPIADLAIPHSTVIVARWDGTATEMVVDSVGLRALNSPLIERVGRPSAVIVIRGPHTAHSPRTASAVLASWVQDVAPHFTDLSAHRLPINPCLVFSAVAPARCRTVRRRLIASTRTRMARSARTRCCRSLRK